MDMTLNRRKFVAGVGTALGAAGLGTTVLADESVSIEIVQVYPIEDVVILENTGDEAVDLGGYVMDWEYSSDPEQVDEFDGGTTIEPGQQLSVWTGFQSTRVDETVADVQLDEYGNGRINADEVDIVALLSPDGEVIDQTEDTVNGGRTYNAEDYDADPDDSDANGDDDTADDGSDEDPSDNDGDDDGEDADDDGETVEDGEEVDDGDEDLEDEPPAEVEDEVEAEDDC